MGNKSSGCCGQRGKGRYVPPEQPGAFSSAPVTRPQLIREAAASQHSSHFGMEQSLAGAGVRSQPSAQTSLRDERRHNPQSPMEQAKSDAAAAKAAANRAAAKAREAEATLAALEAELPKGIIYALVARCRYDASRPECVLCEHKSPLAAGDLNPAVIARKILREIPHDANNTQMSYSKAG